MKVSPISGDLILKIGLALVVGGVAVYIAKKGLTSLLAWPAEAFDKAVAAAREGGATWQARTTENDAATKLLTGTTYRDPLINNDGMDFGQLSG